MQRSSVDLPEPDAPIRQTTSCSATARSMPRRTSSVAERLVQALDAQRLARSPARRPRSRAALSRATSQSVNRASGIVTTMNTRATPRNGVKLKVAACLIWAVRKISTTPMNDTRTVSFWSPMKSLSSGGMTRRTACGRTT